MQLLKLRSYEINLLSFFFHPQTLCSQKDNGPRTFPHRHWSRFTIQVSGTFCFCSFPGCGGEEREGAQGKNSGKAEREEQRTIVGKDVAGSGMERWHGAGERRELIKRPKREKERNSCIAGKWMSQAQVRLRHR